MAEITSRVTDEHPSLAEHKDIWEKVEAVLGGATRLRSYAQRYLPQNFEMRARPNIFANYVNRGQHPGMTARTVEALTGSVFRKPPLVDVPARYKPRLDTINGRGDNLETFSKKIFKEVLSFGRVGLLTTFPEKENSSSLDPLAWAGKVVSYPASSITNWKSTFIGSEEILTQIILREQSIVDLEFGFKTKPAYLVLDLPGGLYRARRFEQVDGGEYVMTSEVIPTNALGAPLPRIPFQFINAVDLSSDICLSPMDALSDTELSFFRSSCDLEEGRAKLAFPIPCLIGVDGEQTTWRMGGDSVWMLPMGADAKMLEFTGDGLGSLERALEQKENHAAMLGARMLAAPKAAAETAESVRLQHSSQTATISGIAHNVSAGLSKAIQTALEWGDIGGNAYVVLNQDFLDEWLAAPELTALQNMAQAGLLPLRDLLISLQDAQYVRQDLTFEEYEDEIQTQTLPGSPPGAQAIPLEEPTFPEDKEEQTKPSAKRVDE